MTRVLSIDLDYIMGPTINLYNNIFYDDNQSTRWRNLYQDDTFVENHFYIDQSNLMFCYNIFLKSLKKCDSVSFGYEHDSILYSISEFDNIDLVNIDHHEDVTSGDFLSPNFSFRESLEKEYDEIIISDRVHEGNWVSWLASKNKINSYTWIQNKNSGNEKDFFNSSIVPNYNPILKEQFEITDESYDHIFVCLSPQYIPKNHWHYFSMFITAYEEFKGQDAKIKSFSRKKYTNEVKNNNLTKEILNQCSNGR